MNFDYLIKSVKNISIETLILVCVLLYTYDQCFCLPIRTRMTQTEIKVFEQSSILSRIDERTRNIQIFLFGRDVDTYTKNKQDSLCQNAQKNSFKIKKRGF